jgi:adenosylmethionine-8-amino-7-oxononanoate aminotransferase
MSYIEQELTKTRQEAIDANAEARTQKQLVELIEKQRDHVESLLLNLAAEAAGVLPHSKAYREAREYLCENAGLDKYERRLDDPHDD